jgi:hypothetical protein
MNIPTRKKAAIAIEVMRAKYFADPEFSKFLQDLHGKNFSADELNALKNPFSSDSDDVTNDIHIAILTTCIASGISALISTIST